MEALSVLKTFKNLSGHATILRKFAEDWTEPSKSTEAFNYTKWTKDELAQLDKAHTALKEAQAKADGSDLDYAQQLLENLETKINSVLGKLKAS